MCPSMSSSDSARVFKIIDADVDELVLPHDQFSLGVKWLIWLGTKTNV